MTLGFEAIEEMMETLLVKEVAEPVGVAGRARVGRNRSGDNGGRVSVLYSPKSAAASWIPENCVWTRSMYDLVGVGSSGSSWMK